MAIAALVAAGYAYLAPASGALLRGVPGVMIGDGTDSITNPWQYTLVLETLRREPHLLLFGGIWSDQLSAPDGVPIFVPFVERFLVVLLAPFCAPDRMPTAIAWALMVLSGACLYALGRALGWPRVIATALALAWAYNPFTRGRATVHIALVGLYWAPLALLALHLLARPPAWLRRRLALPAALLVFVGCAAHYHIIMGAALAPLFAAFYVLVLPEGTPRRSAVARLVLASLPAAAFVGFCLAVPVPPSRTAPPPKTAPEADSAAVFLRLYGAEPIDYVAGDVAFGTRDLLPLRSELTEAVRGSVLGNQHERANGIRWSLLALATASLLGLALPRTRRALTVEERRVLVFAAALAGASFLLAFSPGRLRVLGHDVAPVSLVNRVLPRYRVPNRIATMVHLGALLAVGVGVNALRRERKRAGTALASALPALVLLDYPPLEPVPLASVTPVHPILRTFPDCGAGIAVPYVTWGSPGTDFYELTSEIRGTTCRLIHPRYQTEADEAYRASVSGPAFDEPGLQRMLSVARCTHARFLIFRGTIPGPQREDTCARLGFQFFAPDVCRAPDDTGPPRSAEACTPPPPPKAAP